MKTQYEIPALTDEQRQELIDEIDYNRKHCFLSSKTELLMQIAQAALTAPALGRVNRGEASNINDYPDARVECLHDQAGWENFQDGFLLYAAPPVPALKPIELTYEQKRAIAHSAHFKCQQIRGSFYNAAQFAIEDVLRLNGVAE